MQTPTEIGTPPWTRGDMLAELDAFAALYARRPIRDNRGGMKAPHMFAVWFMARRLAPDLIVESGVWRGQSTWLLEQACPGTQLVCIDVNLDNRAYISPRATYSDQDFAAHHWPQATARSLVFFDDHQDAPARLDQCRRAGLRHLIFEDNYPPGQGDCRSLKQAFAQGGAAAEALAGQLDVYAEFPPVFRTAVTRWNTPWPPTPAPLLTTPDTPARQIFLDEADSYTWICYARLR
jgi:hypothetical protein